MKKVNWRDLAQGFIVLGIIQIIIGVISLAVNCSLGDYGAGFSSLLSCIIPAIICFFIAKIFDRLAYLECQVFSLLDFKNNEQRLDVSKIHENTQINYNNNLAVKKFVENLNLEVLTLKKEVAKLKEELSKNQN